jgi:hypothetical protein
VSWVPDSGKPRDGILCWWVGCSRPMLSLSDSRVQHHFCAEHGSPSGVGFSATRLLAALRQVLRSRHLAALSLGEQDALLRAVTQDWEESAKTSLTEWVSVKSQDGTETVLASAASYYSSEALRRSVTGSPMVVAARFLARTDEDARRVHYALNGWGDPDTIVKRTISRRKT